MAGGELFDRIVEKECYSENEAAETISNRSLRASLRWREKRRAPAVI